MTDDDQFYIMNPSVTPLTCETHKQNIEYIYRDKLNKPKAGCLKCPQEQHRDLFTLAYTEYKRLHDKRKLKIYDRQRTYYHPIEKVFEGITKLLNDIQQQFNDAKQMLKEAIQTYEKASQADVLRLTNLKEYEQFAEKYYKLQDCLIENGWKDDKQNDQQQQNDDFDKKAELSKSFFTKLFMNEIQDLNNKIYLIHDKVFNDSKLNFRMLNLNLELLEKNVNTQFLKNQTKKAIRGKFDPQNQIKKIFFDQTGLNLLTSSIDSLTLYSLSQNQFQQQVNNSLKIDNPIISVGVSDDFKFFAVSTLQLLQFGTLRTSQSLQNPQLQTNSFKLTRQNDIREIIFVEKDKPFCLILEENQISIYQFDKNMWNLKNNAIRFSFCFGNVKINENQTIFALTDLTGLNSSTDKIKFYLFQDLISQHQAQPLQIRLKSNEFYSDFDYFWSKSGSEQYNQQNQHPIKQESLFIHQENQLLQFRLDQSLTRLELYKKTPLIKGKLISNHLVKDLFAVISDDDPLINIYKITSDRVVHTNIILSNYRFIHAKLSLGEQYLAINKNSRMSEKFQIYSLFHLPQLNLIPKKGPQISYQF